MTDATQECKFCKSLVPVDAVKCPHCGEWREDIKKERDLCWLWSFITVLPLLVFYYGHSEGWWRPEWRPPPEPSNMASGDPLLESLGQAFRESMARIARDPVGRKLLTPRFDWATFFSSLSGWLIIAAFCVAFGLSLKYSISVSRKMGK
jgi:hypothetical protein